MRNGALIPLMKKTPFFSQSLGAPGVARVGPAGLRRSIVGTHPNLPVSQPRSTTMERDLPGRDSTGASEGIQSTNKGTKYAKVEPATSNVKLRSNGEANCEAQKAINEQLRSRNEEL